MGVYKLWQLLLTIAKPLSIDQLSGKVLAVDASIWIVKIDSLYNTNRQKLKSILSKIMTLKRNNILPIFVFDGVAPAIKRRTLQQRYSKRVQNQQKQAKKKAELQVMRLLQGDTRKSKQRSSQHKQKEQQLSQLKISLQQMQTYNFNKNQQINKEILQKIVMQSQILNHKYRLMLQISPALQKYQHYITYDQYQMYDIDSKKQYLQELEQISWRFYKRQNQKTREHMEYQQKLKYDLNIIEKKCKLRDQQDKYYRKLIQKDVRIENGYQIIETIYNGKKIIQKKKIKNESNSSSWLGGKNKVNFSKFNFKEQSNSQQSDHGQDQFLAQFCNSKIPFNITNHQQKTQIIEKNDKKNFIPLKIIQKSKKQIKPKQNKTKIKKSYGSSNQSQYQLQSKQFQSSQPYQNTNQMNHNQIKQDQIFSYINKQQFEKEYEHEEDQQFINKDNLPEQSSVDFLPYKSHSTDNKQLQNLFKLLGIPYIIAPGQAEAECAALQREGVVDGIITQDSDVFLFGGKNVYRGVFQNNIRYYSYAKIQQKLKLNKQKLIIFALLLGSDYALGVKGVGIVNAMQILKVFGSFSKLQKFVKWGQLPDIMLPQQQRTTQLIKNASQQQKQFYELHRKFKNHWYIDASLTNQNIKKAYLHPQIISPKQILQMKKEGFFDEKQVDIKMIQKMLIDKLQIQGNQLEHYRKLLSCKFIKKKQSNLHDYWNIENVQNVELAQIRSKRLQKSIESLQQNNEPNEQ